MKRFGGMILGMSLGAGLLSGCAATAASPSTAQLASCTEARPTAARNCRLVVEFYEAFFNRHDLSVAETVLAEGYVQHNSNLPNGRKPFVEYFGGYFRDNPQSHSAIKRVSASGDLVWLHIHDTSGPSDPGSATVDIFRVSNGEIVEHWDVIQPVAKQSASGNSVF